MNGDGVLDLAVGNVGGKSVSVLLGSGTGAFTSPMVVPSGSHSYLNTMTVADMNGDGRLDLVTANYKPSNQVTVILQSPP